MHPGERHIYAMPIDGGARTKLTSMTGGSPARCRPTTATFGLVYSSSTKPHEVYLMPNRAGAAARQVTTTPTEEWRSFKWIDPQADHLQDARRRRRLRAAVHAGDDRRAGAIPPRPAVVFVHGAGYAQNAHKYWPSYFREYMFHNLLASRGYVVLDPDYRASSGYGRDWRTAIYRHMGGKDLDDVVDGAKYLVDDAEGEPEADRRLRRQLRRLHHADGDVHDARRLRGRRGAAAGHRLGALQPRLHVEHPQRAAERRRGLPQELADLFRRRAEGRAAHLPRHGRHQRALPGHGASGAAPDRAAQGELVGGAVPGREPRVRGRRRAGRTSTSGS